MVYLERGYAMNTKLTKEFKVNKAFRIKPFKESTESKQCSVELTIPKGVTFRDLAFSVLSSEVIKTQNSNRSKYDKLVDGQVFKRTFKVPGTQIDPEQAMIAKLAGMTPEEWKVYFQELESKLANNDNDVEGDND